MPRGKIEPTDRCEETISPGPEQSRVLAQLGLSPEVGNESSLEERCLAVGLEPATVVRMLRAFATVWRDVSCDSVELMTPGQLCDHIERTNHARLREELSAIGQFLESPELDRIRDPLQAFIDRISGHLQEEADALFPLIRRMETDKPNGTTEALRPLMARMEHDHNDADESLADLHDLAGDGTLPPALRDAIARLEITLQEQIYKENQVLFPKALTLGRGKHRSQL